MDPAVKGPWHEVFLFCSGLILFYMGSQADGPKQNIFDLKSKFAIKIYFEETSIHP